MNNTIVRQQVEQICQVVRELSKKKSSIRGKTIDIFRVPVIREIKRVSKPGLRLYSKGKDCKSILNGQGISILSTSKGIKSDRQCRNENIGGEVLCKVS